MKQLRGREREIELWMEKGLTVVQAENVVTPTKTDIAKQNDVSLTTVQNVHRVMRETRIQALVA